MNLYRTRVLGAQNRFCKVIQQTFLNNTQPGGPSRRYALPFLVALFAVAFQLIATCSAQASSLASTPSSVSFGTVPLGNKVTQTLAIKNVTLKNSSGTVLLTVSLSGTGSGSTSNTSTPLTSTPSSVSYGTVAVGNKVTQTLMIKNVSSSSVPVSSISISNPAFSISSLTMPFSIAAGVTNYFAVGFKPTVSGSVTGNLTMKNSAGTVLVTVPLSGTGSSPTSSLLSSLSS